MSKKNLDINRPPAITFARGTPSYFLLAFLIGAALIFGVFERRNPNGEYEIIGSYAEYNIMAKKQGKNTYEITLHNKETEADTGPIEITNIENVLWIVAQTYQIRSSFPLEENQKTFGLIIYVEDD